MNVKLDAWPPPRLETERLIMRAPVYADGPLIHALMADPEVVRFMPYKPSPSIAITQHVIGLWVTHAEQGLTTYAICPRGAVAAPFGILQVRKVAGSSTVEPGIVLGTAAWGLGYAREALRALRLSMPPGAEIVLRGGVDRENHNAVAMLSKIGLAPAAVEPASRLHPNVSTTKRDVVVFERRFPLSPEEVAESDAWTPEDSAKRRLNTIDNPT